MDVVHLSTNQRFGKKLNRSSSHRAAMRRNFIVSVIKHERVTTTLERAKAMRRSHATNACWLAVR